MSTRTTSARPASAIRWAVVAPTLPAPMTVTLLRAMRDGAPFGRSGPGHCRPGRWWVVTYRGGGWTSVDVGVGRSGRTIATDPPTSTWSQLMTLTPGLTLI